MVMICTAGLDPIKSSWYKYTMVNNQAKQAASLASTVIHRHPPALKVLAGTS